jgi:hypothetical protein
MNIKCQIIQVGVVKQIIQVGVDERQMPDHPSTFMKMVKGRSQAISATNDERCQVLPARVIWDGSIDCFEVFEIM